MKAITLSLITYLLSLTAFAQTGKSVCAVGIALPRADQLFVGEIHSVTEKAEFTREMIWYAYKNSVITNIVRETGASDAYLLNRYIQHDDSTIFRYAIDSANLKAIETWRAINKARPEQFTIYGIDFERMSFIIALKSIFSRNPEAQRTDLYKYIASLPDSLASKNSLAPEDKKIRLATYARARALFKKEKASLKSVVKEDFEDMERILENPCTEQKWSRRDTRMAKNLKTQLGDKKFICILGKYHTELSRFEIRGSAMKQYMRQSGNTPLLILQMHKTSDEPGYIVKNDSAMALAYGKYHNPNQFTLINDDILRQAAGKKGKTKVPTYYVFFDEVNPNYRTPW